MSRKRNALASMRANTESSKVESDSDYCSSASLFFDRCYKRRRRHSFNAADVESFGVPFSMKSMMIRSTQPGFAQTIRP